MNSKQVSNMLDINMRLINKITDISMAEERAFASIKRTTISVDEWQIQEEVVKYLTSIQTHLEQAQWKLNQLEDKLIEQEEYE